MTLYTDPCIRNWRPRLPIPTHLPPVMTWSGETITKWAKKGPREQNEAQVLLAVIIQMLNSEGRHGGQVGICSVWQCSRPGGMGEDQNHGTMMPRRRMLLEHPLHRSNFFSFLVDQEPPLCPWAISVLLGTFKNIPSPTHL